MNAVNQSSIRKAAGSKRTGAVRRKASIRRPARTLASQVTPASAKARYLTLGRSVQNPEKKLRVRIPAVLLEGDSPGTPSPLPRAPRPKPATEEAATTETAQALPAAYGTQRLKLTPRDPHWIHAHWDFTQQQLRDANARSAGGHLVLRTFERSAQGPLVSETHVHPESTRWLVHVPQSGVPYAAELGFYSKRRRWSALAASNPICTPPAGASADQSFEVATLTPRGKVLRHGAHLAVKPPPAQPERERSSNGRLLSSAGLQQDWSQSLVQGLPGAIPGAPSSLGISSWTSPGWLSSFSSPMGGAQESSFRLEVNAELIVYGATEPGATLQVGKRTIPLNADGSFRFRFALPDGTHDLPIKATAAGTGEQRSAGLRVARQTDIRGHVDSAPSEPGLKPPAVENL